MDTYDCKTPVRHNGKLYRDTIELSDEDALPLLEVGAIAFPESEEETAALTDLEANSLEGGSDAVVDPDGDAAPVDPDEPAEPDATQVDPDADPDAVVDPDAEAVDTPESTETV